MKLISGLGALALSGILAFAVLVAVIADGSLGVGGSPSAAAIARVPAEYLALYQAAAAACPGLPWAMLAAVGTIESDNGQSAEPGVRSGSNPAGAEGPMQFEPSTFAEYAVVGPGGADPPSPYDATDAIYSAANLLCSHGGGDLAYLSQALFAYNHSDAYVAAVLQLAATFSETSSPSSAASTAVSFAQSQIGVPYRWGAAGAGGFDCSGLVQAAYAAAGIALPRVAQDQFDAGPVLPPGSELQPGDLVFFGSSSSAVTHVGIYVGDGDMVDAPHTGALVRSEPANWPDYLGATRPAR